MSGKKELRTKPRTTLMYALALLIAQRAYAAHIIFDLGGVLLEQNYEQALHQFDLSKRDYLWYMLSTGTPPRTRLFTLLDAIAPRNAQECDAPKNVPCDELGAPLPQLMCEWQRGTSSPEEIRDYILAYCAQHPELTQSPLEHKILTHMVTGMFTPEKFAKMQQWNPEGLKFLHTCKAQGHKVYVLSNWDAGTFSVMYQQPYFRKIFDLFDGIMISGNEHMAKPDPGIYRQLLTTYNLDAKQSIFIDDQLINVRAARSVGIAGIWCRPLRSLLAPWKKFPDFSYVQNKFAEKIALINALLHQN